MEDNVLFLYCVVDDFFKVFEPALDKHLLETGVKKRKRSSQMSDSEVMTIFIHFHQVRFRDFKSYYFHYVKTLLKRYFPQLLSYNRFIERIRYCLLPLFFFLHTFMGEKTGIYFIDSTTIKVCHIQRESRHRVFKGLAQKSRSTMGWFFGFKLHLVINDKGEIMAFKLTQARTDDRKPVPDLVKNLMGKLIGDKGYLSQTLAEKLKAHGLFLITRVRKNMKNRLMTLADKILLRKRAIIETVNDQLKNIAQIEHTRHRSVWNFMANILAALISYSLQPKKPSLNFKNQLQTCV